MASASQNPSQNNTEGSHRLPNFCTEDDIAIVKCLMIQHQSGHVHNGTIQQIGWREIPPHFSRLRHRNVDANSLKSRLKNIKRRYHAVKMLQLSGWSWDNETSKPIAPDEAAWSQVQVPRDVITQIRIHGFHCFWDLDTIFSCSTATGEFAVSSQSTHIPQSQSAADADSPCDDLGADGDPINLNTPGGQAHSTGLSFEFENIGVRSGGSSQNTGGSQSHIRSTSTNRRKKRKASGHDGGSNIDLSDIHALSTEAIKINRMLVTEFVGNEQEYNEVLSHFEKTFPNVNDDVYSAFCSHIRDSTNRMVYRSMMSKATRLATHLKRVLDPQSAPPLDLSCMQPQPPPPDQNAARLPSSASPQQQDPYGAFMSSGPVGVGITGYTQFVNSPMMSTPRNRHPSPGGHSSGGSGIGPNNVSSHNGGGSDNGDGGWSQSPGYGYTQ